MRQIVILLCACTFISCNSDSLKKENEKLYEEVVLLQVENKKLKEELEHYKTVEANRNIDKIGRWVDTRPGSDQTITLIKNLETDKYYMICEFKDGTSSQDEVRVSKEKGLLKFKIIGGNHVEWYIIEKNGDLSMYGQNGKFGTALSY